MNGVYLLIATFIVIAVILITVVLVMIQKHKVKVIKEELEQLLNQPEKTKTEIAIEVMLWIMRRQMFIDGNKRVAMLFANKIMIDNGCGIITISQENQPIFFEKLIKFYETGDNVDLKQWIYDTSIDGIELNNN